MPHTCWENILSSELQHSIFLAEQNEELEDFSKGRTLPFNTVISYLVLVRHWCLKMMIFVSRKQFEVEGYVDFAYVVFVEGFHFATIAK